VQYAAQERGVPAAEVKGEIEAYFPLGEIPTDGDVAEAVGFFLSDRARSISGQTLLVNGAEYCR
jgi:NAD(P)-dependent dehydrogenase (short-subunit alcohol dehydrogenase family)